MIKKNQLILIINQNQLKEIQCKIIKTRVMNHCHLVVKKIYHYIKIIILFLAILISINHSIHLLMITMAKKNTYQLSIIQIII